MHDLNTKTQSAFGRQSGAASVPVLFFLFLLVLFLGAAFFAYSMAEKNNELVAKNAELKQENDLVNARKGILADYTEQLAGVVGSSGTFTGDPGAVYNNLDGVTSADIEISGGPVPVEVKQTIDAFVGSPAGSGLKNKNSLSTLFTDVSAKIVSLEKRISDAESARDDERNRATSLESANQDTDRARQQEVAAEVQKREQEVSQLRDTVEERQGQIDLTNERLSELRSQMTAQNADHQERVRGLRGEIEILQGRIDAQQQLVSLINPPEDADGLVLSASSVTGRAWINLGQRDMLPLGTGFDIVDARDPNKVKGRGIVTRVESDRAEMTLTEIANRLDPIRTDDQVRNDLYSPNLRRNVYLMGRFIAPFTRPVVKAQLEALGNRVVDELSPAVDLVLVGADTINSEGSGFTPLTDTDEFKMASFLRLEMRPVTQMRQFLSSTATNNASPR